MAKAFPIVGVGASAGGLEAFTELLKSLPAQSRMAFVLISHLAPGQESHLSEILARFSKLPVSEVKDQARVLRGHVYVIPPNKGLVIKNGVLRLLPLSPQVRGAGLIDLFFQSLAEDKKERAIGVILSGEAHDGTLGLEAIKAQGGITFAQDENTAVHPSMPQSAVSAGCVDFVLPPQKIAQELDRIYKHPYLIEKERPIVAAAEEESLRSICVLLEAAKGVDFANYKPNTIGRRILRRMALRNIGRPEQYLAQLENDPAEMNALFDDLLIGVSSFFRDPEAFKVLKSKIYPQLLRSRTAREPVRIWIPGCSTGEEAYSHAINFLEFFDNKAGGVRIQIFATDINERALEKARSGIYPQKLELEISRERLRRFFVKLEHGYQISKSIRDLCVFARQDAAKDPPFSNIDLVSCRNVLIYFGPMLQKRAISFFHYALKPGGLLMLGSSEAVGEYSAMFSLVDKRARIYSKKRVPSTVLDFKPRGDFATAPMAGEADKKPFRKAMTPAPRELDLQKKVERVILSQFGPAGVVVSEDMEILSSHGYTNPYLGLPRGKASLDLLKMAREDLLIELKAAIEQAKREGVPVKKEGIPLQRNGRQRELALHVVPLEDEASVKRCYLVLFMEGAPACEVGRKDSAKRSESRQVLKLKQGLAATREHLRVVTQEHEAANAEIRSANEEIISSNEELQSINEELETSKEELQSTNEEMNTINEELNRRNQELIALNNDLKNIMASAQIPLLILGRDLRVRRFTAAAESALNLIPGDIGRPISDIKLAVDVPALDKIIAEVINIGNAKRIEVQDRQGQWYAMWIRPSKADDNKIDGVVIAFLNVNEQKRGLMQSQRAQRFAAEVIDSVCESLVVLDAKLQVVQANKSFYELCGLPKAKVESRPFLSLGAGQWDVPRLKRLLGRVQSKNLKFENFELERKFGKAGFKTLRLNGRAIAAEDARNILLAIEDITASKKAEEVELLRRSEAMQREFVANVSHELRTPLASVQGYAETLRKGALEDTKNRLKFVLIIEKQAHRLRHLVENLLELSRLDSGRWHPRLEPIALRYFISKLLSGVIPLARTQGVSIHIKIPGRLKVVADKAQLAQVMQNLCDNAVKYNHRNGKVVIEARASGKEAVVSVRDNGIGIAYKDLPHIFDRFHRSRAAYLKAPKGSGLGLAITKAIVETHGGRIWVESQEDKGSTFHFTLPSKAWGAR